MIGTVILDAYSADRAEEMARAIDELCPPDASGPFASSGLYAFWDRDSRELLYIGLARDLGLRFRQHNWLVDCPASGCKRERIAAHLSVHPLIGYSIMPQSPVDQPSSHRGRRPYRSDPQALAMIEDLASPGHEELVAAEGQVLRAHVNRHGSLPPWNSIGGSASGATMATPDTEPYLDLLRARHRAALTTRLAMRDLAADAAAQHWENLLHVARFNTMLRHGGIGYDELRSEVERLASEETPFSSQFRALITSGYMQGPS